MSTGCEFYADALPEYAADRLDPERSRRIHRHLAECEACRSTLETIRAVRRHPVPVPDGLEESIRARLRTASEAVAGRRTVGPGEATEPSAAAVGRSGGHRSRWAWGLPLAAAAALAAVWVGVGVTGGGPVAEEAIGADPDAATVEPFGAWPAADGVVAGDPLLSELTEEELERLLEEMES